MVLCRGVALVVATTVEARQLPTAPAPHRRRMPRQHNNGHGAESEDIRSRRRYHYGSALRLYCIA